MVQFASLLLNGMKSKYKVKKYRKIYLLTSSPNMHWRCDKGKRRIWKKEVETRNSMKYQKNVG